MSCPGRRFRNSQRRVGSGLIPVLFQAAAERRLRRYLYQPHLHWHRLSRPQLLLRLADQRLPSAGVAQVPQPNCRLVRHADVTNGGHDDRASAAAEASGALPRPAVDVPLAQSLLRRTIPFISGQ